MDVQMRCLLDAMDELRSGGLNLIRWSCAIPSFGDFKSASIGTVGINPSNLEFETADRVELTGELRRFHTLQSLGLERWSEASDQDVELACIRCREYFLRNPYNRWFKKLEFVISGTGCSFYFPFLNACHLDIVPLATSVKWGALDRNVQSNLVSRFKFVLPEILEESNIRVLVLNGQSVVNYFMRITNAELKKAHMPTWGLPRQSGPPVDGYSYTGQISKVGSTSLGRRVLVLGYNHNLQSSFGVSRDVLVEIRNWIRIKVHE